MLGVRHQGQDIGIELSSPPFSVIRVERWREIQSPQKTYSELALQRERPSGLMRWAAVVASAISARCWMCAGAPTGYWS